MFDYEFWLKEYYPTTIICDRYTGTYSEGLFSCWPLDYWNIPDGVEASDPECWTFWEEYDKSTVGIGNSPQDAFEDLKSKLKNKINDHKRLISNEEIH